MSPQLDVNQIEECPASGKTATPSWSLAREGSLWAILILKNWTIGLSLRGGALSQLIFVDSSPLFAELTHRANLPA